MGSKRSLACAAVLSWACCAGALAQASGPAAAPPVVRTQAEWEAVLVSGQASPLDALTPYGKRAFLRGMRWGDRGLAGFGFGPLVRELDAGQAAAVLAFLDSAAYLPTIEANMAGPPLRFPEPAPQLEQDLVRFERQLDTATSLDDGASSRRPQAPLQDYLDTFAHRMDAAALQGEALGNLPLLFAAAGLAARAYPGSAASSHLPRVHRELVRRGVDTRRGLDRELLEALVGARAFDEARAFAATRPHLARRPVPRVVDALGPGFRGRSVYRYDAGTLVRETAPAPAGLQLVMVVGAGCHYSRDALAALHEDASLRARLQATHLMLVTPPSAPVEPDFMAAWNAANPSLPMTAPYDVAQWGDLDAASVPRFYLRKDGRVIDQVQGWPQGGNRAALAAMLDKAQASRSHF